MRSAIDGMMLMLCRRIPHRNIRCVSIPAVVVYAAMKRLLLLTFMAVASEAALHHTRFLGYPTPVDQGASVRGAV